MTETYDYKRNETYGPFSEDFGTYELTPTSATHIYVDANSGSNLDQTDGLRITVRGIPYGLSVHLYRSEDGTWNEGTDPDALGLYMSRLDRYRGPKDLHPSTSAQEWVRKHLYPLVEAWAESEEGTSARHAAAKIDANNTLWRLDTERAKLAAELAETQAKMESTYRRLQGVSEDA